MRDDRDRDECKRGVIKNVERKMQLADFSGLRWGKITPTDIDGLLVSVSGLLDFGGELFIALELKTCGAGMPRGQRYALRNLSSAIARGGAACHVLVAEHDTPVGTAIDAANADVVELCENGQWRLPSRSVKVREAVDFYLMEAKRRRL